MFEGLSLSILLRRRTSARVASPLDPYATTSFSVSLRCLTTTNDDEWRRMANAVSEARVARYRALIRAHDALPLLGPTLDGDGLPSDSNDAWGGWRDVECTSGADNRVYLERLTRNASDGARSTFYILFVLRSFVSYVRLIDLDLFVRH